MQDSSSKEFCSWFIGVYWLATAGIIQELEKGEIKYSSIRQVLYVMKCPVWIAYKIQMHVTTTNTDNTTSVYHKLDPSYESCNMLPSFTLL